MLLSAIGIAGLIAWILADQQTRRRELAEFEASGVRRRSERAEKAGHEHRGGGAAARKSRLLVLLPLAAFVGAGGDLPAAADVRPRCRARSRRR